MSLDDDYRYALELDKQLNGPIDDIVSKSIFFSAFFFQILLSRFYTVCL